MKKILTELDRRIIRNNIGVMNDYQLARALRVTVNQVQYYRVRFQGGKFVEGISFKEELAALLLFQLTYSGCMAESMNYRIEQLKTKIKNQENGKIKII